MSRIISTAFPMKDIREDNVPSASTPYEKIAQPSIPKKIGKLNSWLETVSYDAIATTTFYVALILLALSSMNQQSQIDDMHETIQYQITVNQFLASEIAKNTNKGVEQYPEKVLHRTIESTNPPMHGSHTSKFIINSDGQKVEVQAVVINSRIPLKKVFK